MLPFNDRIFPREQCPKLPAFLCNWHCLVASHQRQEVTALTPDLPPSSLPASLRCIQSVNIIIKSASQPNDWCRVHSMQALRGCIAKIWVKNCWKSFLFYCNLIFSPSFHLRCFFNMFFYLFYCKSSLGRSSQQSTDASDCCVSPNGFLGSSSRQLRRTVNFVQSDSKYSKSYFYPS